MIDAGGPVEPLLEVLDSGRHRLTHVLLTHHHADHVAELDQVLAYHPYAEVLAHPLERASVPQTTGDLNPGDTLTVGSLTIEALATPGHTAGMLSLLVNGTDVFTGAHPVQGLGRRRARPRPHQLRRPQALGDGGPADAGARDRHPPGPHR